MEADEVMANNFMAEITLWLLPLSGKNNKLSKGFYTMFSKINNTTHKYIQTSQDTWLLILDSSY